MGHPSPEFGCAKEAVSFLALQVSKEKILSNCWNKEDEFQKGGLGRAGRGGALSI